MRPLSTACDRAVPLRVRENPLPTTHGRLAVRHRSHGPRLEVASVPTNGGKDWLLPLRGTDCDTAVTTSAPPPPTGARPNRPSVRLSTEEQGGEGAITYEHESIYIRFQVRLDKTKPFRNVNICGKTMEINYLKNQDGGDFREAHTRGP